MSPHPLTNFEIQNDYQNEPNFNGVYSRNNLPKIKDRTYVINLDDHKWIGSHWITFYVNDNNVTYFDSFGVEHIPIEIRKFFGNKNVKRNIYKIQAYDSIMCEYFCIGLIDFMLKAKRSLECKKLFSLNEYKKNDKILLKMFAINVKNLKKTKIYYIFKKSFKSFY